MHSSPGDVSSLVDEVRAAGTAAGLDAIGVASARPLTRARRLLHERKDAGLHGGMHFTYGNPDRATSPQRLVAGARSLVVGARAYLADAPAVAGATDGPLGRVARYAWRDHYAELRGGLDAVASVLQRAQYRTRVILDDNGLVDREVAYEAGIGWFGKNANLLLPGRGSWFVLGSVVTDAPLPPARERVADGCGACRRCLDACPTGAIVAPGVVDARRCLAWLVQAPGWFPREHRDALGDRLYGCDDCQEVCPPNRAATNRYPADPADAADEPFVPLLELLEASDDELLSRHGRWYIPRRDPRHLRRNALVILGNIGSADDGRVVAALERALRDPDPLLRGHAAWAAGKLGLGRLADERLATEEDADVLAELAALPSGARS